MKKLIVIAAGFALVAGLAATLQPAEAACGSTDAVNSANQSGWAQFTTPGYWFGTSPYGGLATNEIRGAFWSLGYGNPVNATQPNNDSGPQTGGVVYVDLEPGAGNWIELGYEDYSNGAYFADYYGRAHWGFGADGCIDWDGSDGDHNTTGNPDPDQCNVVLLDDQGINEDTPRCGSDPNLPDPNDAFAGDDVGYFLLLAQSPTAQGNYFMNNAVGATGNPPPDGPATDICLAPLPIPEIGGSSSDSPTQKSLDVSVACPVGPSAGVYLNCSNDQNTALQSGLKYQLYVTNTAVGAPPEGPGSRDLEGGANAPKSGAYNEAADNPSGWAPLGAKTGCGVEQSGLVVSCTGDESIWLCASLIADDPGAAGLGGFETTNCSANAVRVDCGPNLAQPDEPVIKRKPTNMDRGTRRDGRVGGR